jgi:hypothetical protein
MGTLGANGKSEQQRDVYAWEDEIGITEVDEAQVSADEDDAPLTSFPKARGPNKLGVPCTAGKGVLNDMARVEKVNSLPLASGTEISGVRTVEKSVIVRRSRTSMTKRGDGSPKAGALMRKVKEKPLEARSKNGITELPVKPNVLDEVEIKAVRKRAKSEGEAQDGEGTAAGSVEQMASDNLSRVAAFKRVRSKVNELLEYKGSSCFPITEAACAEVEFAQELEMAADSDLKTVCEVIHPAMKEFQKENKEVSFAVAQKWMEAHYRKLSSTVDFHFSIIRHLAGPTFALSFSEESTS